MARSHARILTSVWAKPDFRALDVGAQWLYFALLSQPDLNLCGVLVVNPSRWATLAHDLTAAKVVKHHRALTDAEFVLTDAETCELWIRTFMRYDGVWRTPNVLKAAAVSFESIGSAHIRAGIEDQVPTALRSLWPDRLATYDQKRLAALLKESEDETSGGSARPSGRGSPGGSARGSPGGSGRPPVSVAVTASTTASASASEAAATPPLSSRENSSNGGVTPVDNPDDETHLAIVAQALDIITDRHVEGRTFDTSEAGYRLTTKLDVVQRFADKLIRLAAERPDLDAEHLAGLADDESRAAPNLVLDEPVDVEPVP